MVVRYKRRMVKELNDRIIIHVIRSDWPLDVIRDACRILGDSENMFMNELPSVVVAKTLRDIWPHIFTSYSIT